MSRGSRSTLVDPRSHVHSAKAPTRRFRISKHSSFNSHQHFTFTLQLASITNMMSDTDTTPPPTDAPHIIRYILGFCLIGLAWGFTTPFIRKAARTHSPPPHPILDSPAVRNSWVKSKVYTAFFGVVDLLRNPRYAIPLVINLTGSVWFFLLIGKAGEYFSALLVRPGFGCWLLDGGCGVCGAAERVGEWARREERYWG